MIDTKSTSFSGQIEHQIISGVPMSKSERFRIGLPVMCWNSDNIHQAKMRVYIDHIDQSFSVAYPGYDSAGRIEQYEHICELETYQRYITTPNRSYQAYDQREEYVLEPKALDVIAESGLRRTSLVPDGIARSHI